MFFAYELLRSPTKVWTFRSQPNQLTEEIQSDDSEDIEIFIGYAASGVAYKAYFYFVGFSFVKFTTNFNTRKITRNVEILRFNV